MGEKARGYLWLKISSEVYTREMKMLPFVVRILQKTTRCNNLQLFNLTDFQTLFVRPLIQRSLGTLHMKDFQGIFEDLITKIQVSLKTIKKFFKDTLKDFKLYPRFIICHDYILD